MAAGAPPAPFALHWIAETADSRACQPVCELASELASQTKRNELPDELPNELARPVNKRDKLWPAGRPAVSRTSRSVGRSEKLKRPAKMQTGDETQFGRARGETARPAAGRASWFAPDAPRLASQALRLIGRNQRCLWR